MAEYTPNTHAVRETYAANPFNGIPADGRAEFDRWLAAERARIWDAAVQVGVEHEARSTAWIEGRIGGTEPPWPPNPYRDA